MDLKSFESLIKQENSARLFLVKSCWKNYRRFCIKCRGYKIYRIIGKRYRCKRCGYTFHDFSGRWINELHITPKQWLWVIKLFELELSAKKISEQITLSYPTVLKAAHMIRLAIVANSTNSDESPQRRGWAWWELLWWKAQRKQRQRRLQQSPCFRHSWTKRSS